MGNDYYFDLLVPRKMELGAGLFYFNPNLGGFLEADILQLQIPPVDEVCW